MLRNGYNDKGYAVWLLPQLEEKGSWNGYINKRKSRPKNKESFQGMFLNDRDLFTGRYNYSKHVCTWQ